MAKADIPKLTESQIRKLVSAQMFDRGMRYFKDSAISNAVLYNNELRAECAGSGYNIYELSVVFEKKDIAVMDCSCPYDHGGACKHLVALLLTYTKNPDDVRRFDSIDNKLANSSKDELITIIKQMVKRDANLLNIIDVVSAGPTSSKPMDVSAYRKQAVRAMKSESLREITRELKLLGDIATKLSKSGDWLNAGIIYQAVLEEAVNGYGDMMIDIDYDGEVCILIDDLAKGLMNCLKNIKDDREERQAWIETLLNCFLKDLDLGGIDLAPTADEAIMKFADAEEWEWVENRLRDQLNDSNDFNRECIVRFLTEGIKKRKRKTDANQVIRDFGTMTQQAYLLISEGKIIEASKLVKKIMVSKPGLRTSFADAFLSADAKNEALTLIKEDDGWAGNSLAWLAKYYRKYGTDAEAINAHMDVFKFASHIDNYKMLCKLSKEAGEWEIVRVKAIKHLEHGKQYGLLIEIALYESDIARALSLLPKLETQGGGSWQRDFRVEIARSAEKIIPQVAIKLYRELAEDFIKRRSRSSYQIAIDYLKRVKKLMNTSDGKIEWQKYMLNLRARYSTLKVLHDELNKVKL